MRTFVDLLIYIAIVLTITACATDAVGETSTPTKLPAIETSTPISTNSPAPTLTPRPTDTTRATTTPKATDTTQPTDTLEPTLEPTSEFNSVVIGPSSGDKENGQETSIWEGTNFIDATIAADKIIEPGMRYLENWDRFELIGRVEGVQQGGNFMEGDENDWYLTIDIGEPVHLWLGSEDSLRGITNYPRDLDNNILFIDLGTTSRYYEASDLMDWARENNGAPIIVRFALRTTFSEESMSYVRGHENCDELCQRDFDLIEEMDMPGILESLKERLNDEGYVEGEIPNVLFSIDYRLAGFSQDTN